MQSFCSIIRYADRFILEIVMYLVLELDTTFNWVWNLCYLHSAYLPNVIVFCLFTSSGWQGAKTWIGSAWIINQTFVDVSINGNLYICLKLDYTSSQVITNLFLVQGERQIHNFLWKLLYCKVTYLIKTNH